MSQKPIVVQELQYVAAPISTIYVKNTYTEDENITIKVKVDFAKMYLTQASITEFTEQFKKDRNYKLPISFKPPIGQISISPQIIGAKNANDEANSGNFYFDHGEWEPVQAIPLKPGQDFYFDINSNIGQVTITEDNGKKIGPFFCAGGKKIFYNGSFEIPQEFNKFSLNGKCNSIQDENGRFLRRNLHSRWLSFDNCNAGRSRFVFEQDNNQDKVYKVNYYDIKFPHFNTCVSYRKHFTGSKVPRRVGIFGNWEAGHTVWKLEDCGNDLVRLLCYYPNSDDKCFKGYLGVNSDNHVGLFSEKEQAGKYKLKGQN